MIRGAGHMVPMDAPGAINRLVSLWTHSEPLPSGRNFDPAMLAAMLGNTTSSDDADIILDDKNQETVIYLWFYIKYLENI